MDDASAVTQGNLAQTLGRYFAAARFEDLSAAVVDKAIEHIWYLLIRAVQGHSHPYAVQAREIALTLSEGAGSATVIGVGRKALPIDAAFANSSQMRALEMGDNLWPVGVHAGIIVTPAALAMAERRGRSGKDLITAVVSGYEAMGKLSSHGQACWSAAVPHRDTTLYGPFGSAVASALLMRLDADRMSEAIRYAAQHTMGIAEGLVWDHYYALLCRNGVMSATLAEAGGRVSPTVLEGEFGLFETFLGSTPPALFRLDLTRPRGEEILGARTKRLPGTSWNIVPIEFMRDLVKREGLKPADVARIDIALSDARRNFHIGHHLGPYEPWRACSSAPFQMAMVLLDAGESRVERYWQNDNPQILDIVGKMTVTLEGGHADENYTRIEVTTLDGRRIRREGEHFAYDRWNDREEMRKAGEGLLPAAKLERACDLIERLPELDDVGELMACLTP